MSKWLVTGSAGYIGRNVLQLMQEQNFSCVGLDMVENNHVVGNYGDTRVLQNSLVGVNGIIHLGALKNPIESIINEHEYQKNNFLDSQILFETAREFGVNKFIFASSAAVYGYSKNEPVREEDAISPTTPYGRLKMEFEQYLAQNAGNDFSFSSLRLFNVAGVGVRGAVDTSNFSLIPQVIRRVRENDLVFIYGSSYETPDGSAMRDYVHVTDVARSFVNAAQKLDEGKTLSAVINVASGAGTTVQEVVNLAAAVSGREIKTLVEPERPGDIGISIGDNRKARDELDWAPERSLWEIVDSAWRSQHPGR